MTTIQTGSFVTAERAFPAGRDTVSKSAIRFTTISKILRVDGRLGIMFPVRGGIEPEAHAPWRARAHMRAKRRTILDANGTARAAITRQGHAEDVTLRLLVALDATARTETMNPPLADPMTGAGAPIADATAARSIAKEERLAEVEAATATMMDARRPICTATLRTTASSTRGNPAMGAAANVSEMRRRESWTAAL